MIPSDIIDPAEREDFNSTTPPDEDSSCELKRLHLVWVRNFEVDEELVAVAAGVLGRVRPHPWDMDAFGSVHINVLLAALFALGSLDQLPSIEEEVSPQVNAVYMFFMIFPVAMAASVLFVAWTKREEKLPIPSNGWELMVLGSGEDAVPQHDGQNGTFPKLSEDLVYGHSHQHLGIHHTTTKASLHQGELEGTTSNNFHHEEDAPGMRLSSHSSLQVADTKADDGRVSDPEKDYVTIDI